MPRTWSNVRYTETRSAAQKISEKPSSRTLFVLLILVNLALFWGLIAYTMNTVIRHPVTEIPAPQNPGARR